MTLAHQLLGDDELIEYFRGAQVHAGCYVIMDNGLMERGEPLPMETLIDLTKTGCCNEVVLPDKFQDGFETVRLVDEALRKLDSNSPGPVNWMGVVQGKDLKEAITCYLYMLRHPKVDIIGIPKVMEANYGRFQFLCHCFGVAQSYKPIHLLGIWTTPTELLQYKDFKIVRSCDSNFPAATALERRRVSKVNPTEKSKITPQQFEQISLETFKTVEDFYEDNLFVLEELAEGKV